MSEANAPTNSPLNCFSMPAPKLGDWEIGKLGDWEIGRLGDWEIRRLGDWEIGRLGGVFLKKTKLRKLADQL